MRSLKMPIPDRGPVREAVGELVATTVLVTVVFVSGTVRVQLGVGTMGVALLGSKWTRVGAKEKGA